MSLPMFRATANEGEFSMEEIWKDVKGYEGIYKVSNLGMVKRLSTEVFCRAWKKRRVKEKVLKPCINTHGYYALNLSHKNKKAPQRLHRIIASAFVPNPENKKEVNHKDGNKLNNALDNLEWVTHRENGIHAYENGLNYSAKGADNSLSKSVKQFDLSGKFIKQYGSIHEAARETNIHHNTIGANLYGRTRACKKLYKFTYA